MDTFIASFANTRLKLFATQFATGNLELDVNVVLNWQSGQIGDIFEIQGTFLFSGGLFCLLRPQLDLIFETDNFKITQRGHKFRQLDLMILHDQTLQILMTPNKMSQPRLFFVVSQGTCWTARTNTRRKLVLISKVKLVQCPKSKLLSNQYLILEKDCLNLAHCLKNWKW